jgi:SRSO17 transposase
LPADTPIKTLAATIKARWICEQAHQQLKEELGLDHFEGRSWTGLHRHALMTMIAYAFLQSRRLNQIGGGKKNSRTAAAAKPARRATSHSQLSRPTVTRPMSPLLPAAQAATPTMICQSSASRAKNSFRHAGRCWPHLHVRRAIIASYVLASAMVD